ncbi:hypothetical protein [Mycolicibacterium brumae]|uniref:hypothetical protein n=1 Tax=Mycolicibacterium brumae TaxID=85968 RepID=UPI001F4DB7C8|nr:hypothetical protein [Mycolicibacterium brumae]
MTASTCSRVFATLATLMLFGFGTTACAASDTPSGTSSTTSHRVSTTIKPGSGKPAYVPATPSATPKPTAPMIPNPNGDGTWVPCEGSICTNPNNGAGDEGGYWIPNPNGDGTYVPCEGSICTNPNHGAGDDGDVPCEGSICTNPNNGGGDDVGPPEPGDSDFTDQG